MNQPPLNPDALDAGHEAYRRAYYKAGDSLARCFEKGLSAYLAVAQPEVTQSEELSILIGDVKTAIEHEHLDPREFIDLNDVLWALKAQAQPEVTSVEELEALPEGTILRDSYGLALHKRTANWWVTNCDSNLTSEDLADEIADTAHTYTVLYRPEVKP